jgi:hypothetical protein
MKKIALALMLAAAGAAHGQYSIVSNIPGTFMDISGTGTPLNLSDDGSANITTSLLGVLRVGNNGGISRNTTAALGFTNAALPQVGTFFTSGAFLPAWDDMYGGTTALGNVYWQELSDRVVVQWTRNHFDFRTDTITFQAQLFGATGPGLAQYLYQDMIFAGDTGARDNGASATIGYQHDAASFAQWSFNTASVQNGMVLTVIPAPASVALLGLGGLVAARRRRA